MSVSVDKALRKARSHLKSGELTKAEELYKQVLSKFPRNKKAIQGYQKLKAGIAYRGPLNSEPPREKLQELMVLYNLGQFEEVLVKVKPLISLFPKAIGLFTAQGVSNAALQRYDAAIESYEQAIRINPNFADAHYNLGNAMKEIGNLRQAIESYRASLEINPNDTEVLLNCGNALKSYGDFDQAIEIYSQALQLDPNSTAAQANMDKAVEEKTDIDKQVSTYARMSNLEIGSAEMVNFTATLLKARGYPDAAVDSYKQAIKLKPDYAEAYLNMGNILKDKGELDAALESYKKATKVKPDYAEAHYNMGISLLHKDDEYAAIDSFKQAIKVKPDYAEAHSSVGSILNFQGYLEKAIEAYKKALLFKPNYAEAHQNLSFAFLQNGNLKEGLEEYEWRWKTAAYLTSKRSFSQPLWDGKNSLQGKTILVWCEQGVGDTINWSSCLPLLASQAKCCILECQKKLVPLLSRSFPNIEVKAENRNLDLERFDFDFHLPMGSLYKNFIPKISQNAKADAFLTPDPARVKFWRERLKSLGNGPYVGISWKSSNMSPLRLPNYASISDWSSILTLPNVTFINLQYIDFADDLTKIKNELGVKVHNFDNLDHHGNLDDVAALAAALDIVVSTSSSVPLITAGVGTSTKLASWRQSAWNNVLFKPVGPSVDILERNTWEPWDNIFRLIAEDIVKLTDN